MLAELPMQRWFLPKEYETTEPELIHQGLDLTCNRNHFITKYTALEFKTEVLSKFKIPRFNYFAKSSV